MKNFFKNHWKFLIHNFILIIGMYVGGAYLNVKLENKILNELSQIQEQTQKQYQSMVINNINKNVGKWVASGLLTIFTWYT